MSYLSNIKRDHTEVNYFIRLGSRIKVPTSTTWTAFPGTSSTVYYTNWTRGYPGKLVTYVTPSYTEKNTLLNAYSFQKMRNYTVNGREADGIFYDAALKRLYATAGAGFVPPPSGISYLEHFFYISTKTCGFHQKPDDENYPMVQYRGYVLNIPQFRTSVNQSIYGFLPSQSGTIQIANHDGYLFGEFFDGVITNGTFEVYRCVGEVRAENTQLVFRGFIRSASYTDDTVNIDYVDMSSILDMNMIEENHTTASTIEPDARGTVIKSFMGGVFHRQVADCISYSTTKSTGTCRSWYAGMQTFQTAVQNGITPNETHPTYYVDNTNAGGNSSTRTYLTSVSGLSVGMWLLDANQTFGHCEITDIGANYIDHSTLSSGALGTDGYFTVLPVQNVYITDRSTNQTHQVPISEFNNFFRDGFFRFKSSVESTLGITAVHPEDVTVYVDWISSAGAFNFLDTGAPLGTINSKGINQNPVQMIYELLYLAGFRDSTKYYDGDSFQTIASEIDISVDVVTPLIGKQYQSETYREIISRICRTCLLKLYIKNGKWFIDRVKPMPTANIEIGHNDIKEGFDYRQISEEIAQSVTLKFDFGEVSFINSLNFDSWQITSAFNRDSSIINNNSKTLVIEACTSDESIAEIVRDRFLALFSLPLGYLKLELSLEFINLKIGDTVKIISDNLNLPFTGEKTFSVMEITEKPDSIVVQLFDQRGVEENSGDW